jgi:hypothetical protein
MMRFSSGMNEVTIDASDIGIPAGLGWVVSVPRAVVYLTVDWSMPERHVREKFVALVRRFTEEELRLGIQFFVLPDEEPFVFEWLRELLPVQMKQGHEIACATGAGSMLWLCHGRPAKWIPSPIRSDLVAETVAAFGLHRGEAMDCGTISNVPPSPVR